MGGGSVPALREVFFVLAGYLSGSVLYAHVFAKLLQKGEIIEMSPDHNPGASNAFRYGGFWCGVLTLVCDLWKGYAPVSLYMTTIKPAPEEWFPCALVLAAPVIGHAFPLFFRFQGGKGIAVSFGCLLGLLPIWQPVALLAFFFIFFSVVLKITPHYHRTLVTYICLLVSVYFVVDWIAIRAGVLIISSVVILKLLRSKEEKEQMGVQFLWMH